MKWTHIAHHHVNGELNFEQVKDYHTRPVSKKGRGWSDIGYHFFIERDGTVKEGRPLTRRGAHSIEANGFAIGVCMSGNFMKKGPTEAQYKAAAKLDYKLMQQFEIRVENIRRHKDFSPTECPGKLFDMNKLKVLICELINPKPRVLYKVQVGAFAKKENAERLVAELEAKGYSPFIKREEV